MDRLINKKPDADGQMFGTGFSEAIRECDRLARAWDALTAWLIAGPVEEGTAELWVLDKMAELTAPPKAKSKLERLREWASESNYVDTNALLKKIDRLIAEGEDE